MRGLVSLVLVGLLAACAAGGGSGEGTTPTITTPGATTTQGDSTTTSAPSTTSTAPPGPPVAWLAESGVPMAVTDVDGSGVEVMTPCGDPVWLEEGSPVYDVDVLLDPGHGGPVDTGALGFNGLPEKEINLEVALATADLLEARGVAVMLTRVGDYPVPIPVRTTYAELIGAEALVSIHHNAPEAPSSDIPGVEIFVKRDSTDSQRLGGLLYDATMSALSGFTVDWQRAPDAGVMTVVNTDGEDAYGMVRRPEMPSALVELGYIANDSEALLYRQREYVSATAGALADAIEAYLLTDIAGAEMVEGRIFDPQPGVGADQCVDVDLERALYPDVVEASVVGDSGSYDFTVTISSAYDSPDRYADGFRLLGNDGVVYASRELTHDHAAEQPFTRTLGGIEIPIEVSTVTVQARDQVYGWGGDTVELPLP